MSWEKKKKKTKKTAGFTFRFAQLTFSKVKYCAYSAVLLQYSKTCIIVFNFRIEIVHTENQTTLFFLVRKCQCQSLVKYATKLTGLAHQTILTIAVQQRQEGINVCLSPQLQGHCM